MPPNERSVNASLTVRPLKPPWMLVERYVEHYPDDWRLVFRRGEEILEVTVPEDVWRAFDGIPV